MVKKTTRPTKLKPPEHDEGRILSWAEVNRTHRIQNGVYQKGGRLVSLLTDFGRINPCYPDTRDAKGDRITYTGAGRRGDQHLSPANRALLSAIETGHAVPLFNKLAEGRWQHMGFWRVTNAERRFDEKEQRMLWRFTLRRVKAPKKEAHRRRSLKGVRKHTL
jgi:hypothetical protein